VLSRKDAGQPGGRPWVYVKGILRIRGGVLRLVGRSAFQLFSLAVHMCAEPRDDIVGRRLCFRILSPFFCSWFSYISQYRCTAPRQLNQIVQLRLGSREIPGIVALVQGPHPAILWRVKFQCYLAPCHFKSRGGRH